MSRRVVVTGVGLLCGLGVGTEEVWEGGLRRAERHRSHYAL